MKQGLESVNKDGIIDILSSVAQDRISQNNINSVINNADVKKVVETALRDQVEKEVSKQIAPYQEQLNTLSAFFNGGSNLTPSSVSNSDSLTGAPDNYRRVIDMTATAYAPGPLDNGKWNNLTYVGGTVKKGVVAVDPRVIPMGTKLWVEGYGQAVAEDQGSAIKGNRIDLAFNDRQDALDYGIQKVKVYVLN
ncbi:Cell wall-binding protein YocH [bioreactor metagenome]|uniref:Cell wall-binding protein YocH n=1 Tax=bioreactor metagenome TaxID=1076179 RepID=A0A645H5F6_9ZZZZ